MKKIAVVVVALCAMANAQDTKIRTTKPDDENGRSLRDQVFRRMADLTRQMGVAKEVLDALKGSDGGGKEAIVRRNLVRLKMLEDRAELLTLVSPSVERLRWELDVDRHRKLQLAKRREAGVREVQAKIDAHAKAVFDAEERIPRLARGSSERQALENQKRRNEAAMDGLIGLRDRRARTVDISIRQAKSAEQEMADLATLRAHLNQCGDECETSVAMVYEAIEDGSELAESEELAKQRRQIRDAIALMQHRRPPVPDYPPADPEALGIPVSKIVKDIKKDERRPVSDRVKRELDRLRTQRNKSKRRSTE